MDSFEKKLLKIKEIVEILESGDLSLDESLKKFEKGTKLIKDCHKKLEEVKKKIKIVVESSSGSLNYKDFELDEEE